MSSVGDAAFSIGQWRVDPALDEISRNGKTAKLEPRTMRVLIYLAEHPGKVVSVNQLLDVVWKDLVVTPYSVYQAVASLRRALGDDPKDPTYIASVIRRGYRLVAPVEAVAQAQDAVQPSKELGARSDLDKQQSAAKDKLELVASASIEQIKVRRRVGLRYGSALLALLMVAAGVLWLTFRLGQERTVPVSAAAASSAVPFNPPAHSIAVLPFINLSGDPNQEYFSDGLTEELLNSLTRINELQVAARTSSFSFQGERPDLATVARKLNVASVLEGSVRRSGNTIRVTAQLNNAVTGFHLWSETYDRDLGDVLKLQTDIANAVAGALKVTLLDNVSAKIGLGGTHNPAAFDAYLRGAKAATSLSDAELYKRAIAEYTEAIRLDPNYALAFALRSRLYTGYGAALATGASVRESFDKARADARDAIRLAPELAEGHVALGEYFEVGALDFTQAREAYERALALAPGNARVLRPSGSFLVSLGRFDEGISAGRHAVTLDPLSRSSHDVLGFDLYYARRYREAILAYSESLTVDPAYPEAYGYRGLSYYGIGDLESARSSCETKPDFFVSRLCLAVVYDRSGRHADAEAVLAKMKAALGDAVAFQYAEIYAQWGNQAKALDWLDTALRMRDSGLRQLRTDPLMDPLRNEPRFQAIERQLKFPS